jgi:hypothetical protein
MERDPITKTAGLGKGSADDISAYAEGIGIPLAVGAPMGLVHQSSSLPTNSAACH